MQLIDLIGRLRPNQCCSNSVSISVSMCTQRYPWQSYPVIVIVITIVVSANAIAKKKFRTINISANREMGRIHLNRFNYRLPIKSNLSLFTIFSERAHTHTLPRRFMHPSLSNAIAVSYSHLFFILSTQQMLSILTRSLVHLLAIVYFLFFSQHSLRLLHVSDNTSQDALCIVAFGNLQKSIIAVVLCSKAAQCIAPYKCII